MLYCVCSTQFPRMVGLRCVYCFTSWPACPYRFSWLRSRWYPGKAIEQHFGFNKTTSIRRARGWMIAPVSIYLSYFFRRDGSRPWGISAKIWPNTLPVTGNWWVFVGSLEGDTHLTGHSGHRSRWPFWKYEGPNFIRPTGTEKDDFGQTNGKTHK